MNYLASPYIQIPFLNAQFNLTFLSMCSWSETSSAIESIKDGLEMEAAAFQLDAEQSEYMRGSKITTTELDADEMRELFDELDSCHLSDAELSLCKRAQCVVNITGVRNGRLHYAPFWAAHLFANRLADAIDGVIIDLGQGTVCSAGHEHDQQQVKGIPLTGAFLTVKAYPKRADENKYFLRTEGMVRFGLPELTLPEVPANLGSDCAYLLRGVAQFLWTQLERAHPEQPFVTVESTLKLQAKFCQYGNPTFHSVEELDLPLALELFETRNEAMLVVRPTPDFEDYYDWLCSLVSSIMDHRLNIQRLEALEAEEVQEQPIAA